MAAGRVGRRLCSGSPSGGRPGARLAAALGLGAAGTILVDLECRRVIDLLPDCKAGTLATWLSAHLGIEIVCRDRGQSYAEGARVGTLAAIHAADRFHVVHNLVDAFEQPYGRHHCALRTAASGEPAARTTSDVGESAVSDDISNSALSDI